MALRDRRWEHLKAYVPLNEEFKAAETAYRSAQRLARSAGVEDPDPQFDTIQSALSGGGSYEVRREAQVIKEALAVGL